MTSLNHLLTVSQLYCNFEDALYIRYFAFIIKYYLEKSRQT